MPGRARRWPGRLAGREIRPLRRQYARSGGDRGRQGLAQFSSDSRSTAMAWAISLIAINAVSDKEVDQLYRCDMTTSDTTSRPICAKAAAADHLCANKPASNAACAPSCTRAASRASRRRSRLHGLEQLPGLAVQRLMAEAMVSARKAIGKPAPWFAPSRHVERPEGRHALHGGSYLSSRSGEPLRARRAYAGGLSVDRRR